MMKIMRHILTTLMRNNIVRMMMLCILMCGAGSAWGRDVRLSETYEVPGYRVKAFYNFASDASAIALVPTTGDFRYRDAANGWYNFGSGDRDANIGFPVAAGDIIIFDFYDTQKIGSSVNTVSNATKNDALSATYPTFNVNASTDVINVNVGRAGAIVSILVMEQNPIYLKNVESRKYLGGANSWGTRASLTDAGAPLELTSVGTNAYSIKNTLLTSTKKHLGSGLFMDNDNPSGGWLFTEQANGYWISNDGNYLTYDNTTGSTGDNNIATTTSPSTDPRALWKMLTKSEAIEEMSHATPSVPEYATFLMSNPNFNRNTSTAGWKVSNDCSNKNLAGGYRDNLCAESYHSPFTISQTLTGVPNGIYKLTAQGFYRQDGTDNDNLPYFFANQEERLFPIKTGSENSMENASTSFTDGLYAIDPIIVVVNNGTLEVGVKNNGNTDLWCIWDNFRLTYYGNYSLPTPVLENSSSPATLTFTDIPAGATISYKKGETGEYTNYTGAAIESNTTITVYYKITYSDGQVFDGLKTDIIIPEVTALEIASNTIIPFGETQQLEINTNSDGIIQYEDYNSSIISVDGNGNITAIDRGETDITVKQKATKYFTAAQKTVHIVVPSTGTGATEYLADIDFSNEIGDDGVIAGSINSMTLSTTENPPFEKGYDGANTEVLRVGNGTGTVVVDKSKIGERDAVKISFDMYYGSLSQKSAGVDILDEEGHRIAGFFYSKYNPGTAGDYDDFGMDWGKITSIGSSSASNNAIYAESNRTTFTITLDYMLGNMTIIADNGQNGRQERSVPMTNFNPMTSFVVRSNYTNWDRRCWFDNLKVKVITGDYSIEPANYTVRYLNEADQTNVKDPVVKKSLAGRTVSLSVADVSDFTTGDKSKKYLYVSDNSSEVRIAEDGSSVITVRFREAAKYTWRLTTTVDTENVLPSGTSFEGDAVSPSYPRFIVDRSGNLYSTEALTSGPQYAVTFTPDHSDYEYALEYTATGEKNVVFLSEAENVAGLTGTNNSGCGIRTSSGWAAYASTPTMLTKGLPRGNYVLTTYVYNNGSTNVYSVKIGDITIMEFAQSDAGLFPHTSEPFGISDENTEITIPACGNANWAFDLFYIRYVGEYNGDPTITTNLKSSYKVEKDQQVPLIITAKNGPLVKWYKWKDVASAYDPASVDVTDAEKVEIIANATGNSYKYTGTTVGTTEYIFAQVVGFGSSVYSNLASVTTVASQGIEGALAQIFLQDYSNATAPEWTGGNAVKNIETIDNDKCEKVENSDKGNRSAYIPLASKFAVAPSVQDGTWVLDYDFRPGEVKGWAPQGYAIYSDAIANPSSTTNYAPETTNIFFGLNAAEINSSVYTIYFKGVAQTPTIELIPRTWYHVHLEATNSSLSVSLTSGKGRDIVYQNSSDTPMAGGMGLGGIQHYIPRAADPTYFDNIEVQIKTAQLLINSDLDEFIEGNDDEYLNEGAGLNFDVPAATEFEWYVSSVAPSKTADGTTAPQLMDDGSVKWIGHNAFMKVSTPVNRASTTITELQGASLASSNLHAVTPTESNEGKYAYGPLADYRKDHIVTVYDAARQVNVKGKDIYRYDTAPEATASGSRWHYLRQLWIPIGGEPGTQETDHLDYVWCVAKNALGEVTSKVAQINIYPQQPVISLHVDDETENEDGERGDMTIPANYMMRLSTVRIQARNLVFSTANMPVPFSTKSEIVFRDESRNEYVPDHYPADQDTKWMYGTTEWTGLLSTTSFARLDGTLEANASVHGYYKSIPTYEPVDFVYGLRQLQGAPFHPIGSHGGAEYRIGPDGNAALTATQEYHYDYGKAVATPLGEVSTKTVWDWSKLPAERSYLTYNMAEYESGKLKDVKDKYVRQFTGGAKYVIDPETGLVGPVMGNKYIMADFYGYKLSELNGFPSDKVMLGLEVVNDPENECMQGNAFIFKPTAEGTLEVTFSKTEGGEDVYLTLNYPEAAAVSYKAKGVSTAHDSKTTITMDITNAMLNKEVSIKASKNSDDATDQYFRIYSATYTPNVAPVTAKEYIADDKQDIQAADTYTEVATPAFTNGMGNTDGFVSLHAEDGAKIKYKLYVGDATKDAITAALNGTGNAALKDEIKALETLDYNPEAYTDTKGNKIGIHVRVNSTIIAWAEVPGMNNSEPLVYETHAATYPVDLRFMYNFTEKPTPSVNKDDADNFFNENYWGENDVNGDSQIDDADTKARQTANAPKAWNTTTKFQIGDAEYTASDFADVEIDGVPYTAANFDKFYITHGTVIDINVMAKSNFQFDGFGAPAVGKVDGMYTITDMMRARAATKYARYHLLYDKAKAKNTNYIAFLIANFKDLEGKFTAQIVMKEGTNVATDPTYTSNITVDDENRIVAPIYHSAHDADGKTVVLWTEDHSARDANNIMTSADEEIYTSYEPGDVKKIYENTFIKPVYRDNSIADNYRARSETMEAEWWFTTEKKAQTLAVQNEFPGFTMPYVTPVRRHQIGTESQYLADGTTPNPDDLWFDLPMIITPGATGRVNNTINADWCSVGRGTKFTVPACKGAVVSMEVRSPLLLTEGGTTFGGAHPVLWKVKYANDATYYETNTPDPNKTVESYIFKYTCPDDWSADDLDIVLGNDYSYMRRIGVSMPVVTSNRDAAIVTLDFSELFPHLDLEGLMTNQWIEKDAMVPYGEGRTGDGYDFDHKTENVSLYRTHYSKEHGAIYYDGVESFQVAPGQEVPDYVPYVNGRLGYTYSNGNVAQGTKISNDGKGTFIVGPFRSITHIRFLQGCSVLGGGGWYMTVGRMPVSDEWKNYSFKNGKINDAQDPRRNIPDFSRVQWSQAKYGSIHNTTTPEWVEMDIEEHIYPVGKDNNDISLIERPDFDQQQGDIWLRFQADKPNVYLFAIEIYGIDPAPEQQVVLETNVLAAQKDDDTNYEPSLRAGSIYHFPYLLQLDESYKPVSSVKGSDDKIMQFNEGREVSLTANPNLGYEFLKWVKPNGSGGWEDVSTDNPYIFNIDNDTELRAVFVHRGIINYITSGNNYGHAPELQQTDARGGFTVAANRGMFSAEGMSLRQWQDAEPLHEWYKGAGNGVSSLFNVSTNHINSAGTGNVTTPSTVEVSRAETGIQVDVFPQFSANTLSILDVTARKGVAARWQFGKKNEAPTMVGNGATPQLVTQMEIASTKDVVNEQTGAVTTTPVRDVIDVKMSVSASINNAGRADAYATVSGVKKADDSESYATFTLPATKGMKVEIGAQDFQYRIDGGDWKGYDAAFNLYGTEPTVKLELRNTDTNISTFELDYIQATYLPRAQKPVLSMQKVDVVDVGATNNVQVQVQTNSNPDAVRFYTTDGSDPVYVMQDGKPMPGNSSTRQVRGNYITINEQQIGTGTTLKVLSMCQDRADSEIATLDLQQYDPDLGLATYVYDSRFINIHEDQIFQKLLKDHVGHFNLLSYDLNPDAAVIPTVITNNTTVFVTSDAVREHLMNALTNPSDPAAHGQTFNVSPLIVGTPLTVTWKETSKKTLDEDPWLPISWVAQKDGNPVYTVNPATATSPATITYTEWLRGMKDEPTRVYPSKTYKQYYRDNGQIAESEPYLLAFYDGMLLDGNKLCISTTTDNAPEHLSANGTQLVFNATELLTRITEDAEGKRTPADVTTFNKTLLALMAPTKNPQLIDVKMSYTAQVTDYAPDAQGWITLDAQMLSALSDGLTVMTTPYLAQTYPQFVASTIEHKGEVEVTNVLTWQSEADDSRQVLGGLGVQDLATIITVKNTAEEVSTYGLDPNFSRTYRIEYNILLDELTFHKVDGHWVSYDGNELCRIEEITDANGNPSFHFIGPINYGIKDVCFNGESINEDDFSIISSPLHETKTGGQWMEAQFYWGFKDCYQLDLSLAGITEYDGDIKVRFYRHQATSPEIVSTNIYDDMEVEPNGEFVMEFNSVMHEVRLPGKYDDRDVEWTAHIIPDDLGNGVTYGSIKGDDRLIDLYDTNARQILLSSEGGTNTLTFHYWHLEEGKKYWLHIPFHILRGYVGEGIPYEYPDEANRNVYEKQMSATHYVGTDSKEVPYFDIPFTVATSQYAHEAFHYIVDNDNWWEHFKETGSPTCAGDLPYYAKWDGDFLGGIDKIKEMEGNNPHPHFYMHVQKKLGSEYDLGTNLMHISADNFSIVGEGQDSTIITAEPEAYTDSDYRGLREDVDDNQTATLHLNGSNVYLQGLTIRNTQQGLDQDGQEYPALFDHGDRNVLYDVYIDGYEESFASFGTLGYIEKSKISGFGDFIVGSGDVWLEDCDIVLRNHAGINLCAPSTKATNKWGFVFNGCTIEREANANLVLDHNWTLARPWGGYDEKEVLKSPSVNFLDTEFKVLPTQGGYAELTEGLRLRFHEYGSTQNGQELVLTTRSIANCMPEASSDYPVITADQAKTYTIANVFGRDNDGYDPKALTKQANAPYLVNDGMVLHWKADPSDLCYLVYYLGDGPEPDWEHAMMFCCVPGVEKDAETGKYPEEAYCYLTNHDLSPIFRTGDTNEPVSFSEMWYSRRKSDPYGADYNGNAIPGMGKGSPSRLWYAVRAANQMGGLSPMSNALMYHAARQYRTKITSGGVKQGDDSGNAYSTIYLDFQARAPKNVKAYALTEVTSKGGEDTQATTLTFTRVSTSTDPNSQDVVYPDQGYLIYGPYKDAEHPSLTEMEHTFIETTTEPEVKLNSFLSGTVGTFLNKVTTAGLGETNEETSTGNGWSVNPVDYESIPTGNVWAFTLQKYDKLGFYKFTGNTLAHHRAYLDTETAINELVRAEGLTLQAAKQRIDRGLRIRIVEDDGTIVDITSAFVKDAEPKGIYDLTGRKIGGIQHLKKGSVYIIDGQKVLWGK